MTADNPTTTLTELTAALDADIKAARKAGDMTATLAAASAALDRLDAAIATEDAIFLRDQLITARAIFAADLQ